MSLRRCGTLRVQLMLDARQTQHASGHVEGGALLRGGVGRGGWRLGRRRPPGLEVLWVRGLEDVLQLMLPQAAAVKPVLFVQLARGHWQHVQASSLKEAAAREALSPACMRNVRVC